MKKRFNWLFRPKVLFTFFILSAIIFGTITIKLYSDRKKEQKKIIETDLKAIAELKAVDIATWLKERLADASVYSHHNFYPDQSLFSRKTSDSFAGMKKMLVIIREHYNYHSILLLDKDKNLILATDKIINGIGNDTRRYISEIGTNKSAFKIYRLEENNQVIIDFFASVKNEKNDVIGFLILRSDPDEYLYPVINRWPIASKSAETVLMERAGDSIRSLNNLKHLPGTAMRSIISINQTNNPGVNAFLGRSRFFEGLDYRGVPAISYWVPIQGTDWKMITKVDSEELLVPLHNQAWAYGIILSMLLLFTGSVLLLVKILYQRSHFKSLYDAEIERKMLVSHFDYLIKNANDIILLANERGEIVEANDAAVRAYRTSREEMLGIQITSLGEFALRKRKNPASMIYESVHHRSDGSSFPVEINEQVMNVEGRKFFQAIIRDISERKAAGEKLLKRENLYRSVLNASPDIIVITDLDGKIQLMSSRITNMLGYENTDELLNRSVFDFILEEDVAKAKEVIQRMFHGIKYDSTEYRGVKSDGSILDVEVTGEFVRDENGLPTQMVMIVRDITTRKKIQSDLDQSLIKYKALFFDSPDAYLITRDGKYIECNKASALLMGGSRSDIIGKSPLMISPEYQPNGKRTDAYLKEVLQEAYKNGSNTFEWMHKKADGTEFLVLINLSLIEYDGYPSLFVTWRDITKIRESESQLRNLSLAIEQSPILVVITDLSGNISYINPAFETTTGYSRLEVIGQNPRVLKSGRQNEQFYKELWDTIIAGQEWRGELINKKKNGEFYWESISITPIHDNSGKITNYLAIKQDITAAKEHEQKILDLNASLENRIEERTAQLTLTNNELAREIEERIKTEGALVSKSNELESFFDVALDLLCIANTSGQFIKVNKAWGDILGYELQELENRTFLDFVHPDDLPATLHAMEELHEQKPVIHFINRYKARNGAYRFIEWHSAPSGEKIYAAARDITERKLKEDFELELLQISTQLTGLQSSEIKDAISLTLERIGRYTRSDRTFIFEFDPGEETFSNTYEWNKDPGFVPLTSQKNIPVSLFPVWWEELRNGRHIAIPDIDLLPERWNSEQRILKPFGDKSILVIPMFSENRLIGYGGLSSLTEKKEFSREEINLLTIWSSMLTSLIKNFHAESLLNKTRKNYETFFNTLDDFLWVLDYNGKIIHFNNTSLVRLGYSLEELAGKSILEVHPPDKQEEAGNLLNRLLTGTGETFSIPLMSKSGQLIPAETKAIKGFWNDMPVIFMNSKDISQIKLSEEKFATAFQSNSAMMAISNFDDGKYVDVNNAFLELLGYARDEIIGKSGSELGLFIDPELRNVIINQLDSNIPVRKIELPLRTKKGEIKIGLLSADTILIGDKKCLLTVNVDISDRKKMEEQLKAAQEEANRANVAKSEFLSRMSHELRTPMNSILGFAQLLDMGDLNTNQQKGIKHILNSGKHLLDLINEVLEISRIEAGKLSLSPEPIQISGIIHEMLEIIMPLANERQLSLDLADSPYNELYILADRQRLKQVLLNLISNAIKYNKPGGTIKVSSILMPENAQENRTIRISITDTGIGISPENLPRLFDPFERTGAERTTTEGTGLGLAVVKKLTVAMGGMVGVESIAGVGSTFWIEFPQTDSQLNSLIKTENFNDLDKNLAEKTGTILYIEDNSSNVELVDQILLSHCSNIKLVAHTHGREAVRLALESYPDLILLDLNLPDIHGSEVLSLLRRNNQTKNIPVVIISADATAHQLEKLIKLGASNYLSKPLDVKELLRLINNLIRS